jgi:16S rRNA G966 N2-methylase RsmD
VEKNKLYYGDNLEVLRQHVKDESVDLIYLDPPFNSRQDYNVLFAEKSGISLRAFYFGTGSGTSSATVN